MLRSLLLLLTFALVGTSQGCRICDSPYDYCGPVMPCGESCGAGGCGHGHYDGGHVDAGYSGAGGCATCGNGGGQMIEHAHPHEAMPIMEGQPMPAPEVIHQGRRPMGKTTTNSVMKPATRATYERPVQATRSQPAAMPAKPTKMSPYPVPGSGNRLASGNSMKSDSGRGLIFW